MVAATDIPINGVLNVKHFAVRRPLCGPLFTVQPSSRKRLTRYAVSRSTASNHFNGKPWGPRGLMLTAALLLRTGLQGLSAMVEDQYVPTAYVNSDVVGLPHIMMAVELDAEILAGSERGINER